ncbi:Hypothetical protein BSM4216_0789 [Bacillus smithii]|nr:Hypothetical protein BSM4216_0789 [Bacillus smithii]
MISMLSTKQRNLYFALFVVSLLIAIVLAFKGAFL